MTLGDDPIIVQSGFKTRPLRDGGGKPSPPPPLRLHSRLAHLGEAIAELAQSCAQEVQRSINRGDRKHPFPDELLTSTRHSLAQAVGLGPEDTEVAAGQPFHLNLITAIAEYGMDIDVRRLRR